MIVPLSLLPPGHYERPVLSLPAESDEDGAVLMTGGIWKGRTDLSCGSCGRILARGLRNMKRARPFVFICPSCNRANALET